MSLPNAIRSIDQEPVAGWRVWHHDRHGLLEVGLQGIPDEIGGFEGYYTRLVTDVTTPKNFSLRALAKKVAAQPPFEIDRDQAINMRDKYDETWALRPAIADWAASKFVGGDLWRGDDGQVVGQFGPGPEQNPDFTRHGYKVRLSPLGKVAIRRFAIPGNKSKLTGKSEVTTDFILDKSLPLPFRLVTYANGKLEPHWPIEGTLADKVSTAMHEIDKRPSIPPVRKSA